MNKQNSLQVFKWMLCAAQNDLVLQHANHHFAVVRPLHRAHVSVAEQEIPRDLNAWMNRKPPLHGFPKVVGSFKFVHSEESNGCGVYFHRPIQSHALIALYPFLHLQVLQALRDGFDRLPSTPHGACQRVGRRRLCEPYSLGTRALIVREIIKKKVLNRRASYRRRFLKQVQLY